MPFDLNLSDYSRLRQEGCPLTDHSPALLHLLTRCGRMVMLSRPPCFGVSTLCSQLKLILQTGGTAPQLAGLKTKFSCLPGEVLHIDFAKISCDTPALFERALRLKLAAGSTKAVGQSLQENFSIDEYLSMLLSGHHDKNPLYVIVENIDAPMMVHYGAKELYAGIAEVIADFLTVLTIRPLPFILLTALYPQLYPQFTPIPADFNDVSELPELADLCGIRCSELYTAYFADFRRACALRLHCRSQEVPDAETNNLIEAVNQDLCGYRFTLDFKTEALMAPADLLAFFNDPLHPPKSQVLLQRKIAPDLKRRLLRRLNSGTLTVNPQRPQDHNSAMLAWRLGLYAPIGTADGMIQLRPATRALRRGLEAAAV